MQRYKHIFGNTPKTRELPQQKFHAAAANRMTVLGMPVSVKIYSIQKAGSYVLFSIYSTTPILCFTGSNKIKFLRD